MKKLKYFEVTIKQCLPRVFKTVVTAEDVEQAKRYAHLLSLHTSELGDWDIDVDGIQPDGYWNVEGPVVGRIVKVEERSVEDLD